MTGSTARHVRIVALGAVATAAGARRALADFGFPPPESLTTTQGIVRGVVVTLVVELLIVAIYCRRRRLPMGRLLGAGLVGNALSLPVVWYFSIAGWVFLAYFGLIVFLLVELFAALFEGLLYRLIGRLRWSDAIRLSLIANAATMALSLADQVMHPGVKEGPPVTRPRPASAVAGSPRAPSAGLARPVGAEAPGNDTDFSKARN